MIKKIIGFLRYRNDKYIKHILLGAVIYFSFGSFIDVRAGRVAATVALLFGWELLICWLEDRPMGNREFLDMGVGAIGMLYAMVLIG